MGKRFRSKKFLRNFNKQFSKSVFLRKPHVLNANSVMHCKITQKANLIYFVITKDRFNTMSYKFFHKFYRHLVLKHEIF